MYNPESEMKNTKQQAPNTSLFQFGLTIAMSPWLLSLRNVCSQVDVWSLELIWSLELGVWFFVFGVWMLGFGAL